MNLTVTKGGFYYQKDTPIFNDINFSVDAGDILAILGPNGAGKTTMLRCITGMLKWKQAAGKDGCFRISSGTYGAQADQPNQPVRT